MCVVDSRASSRRAGRRRCEEAATRCRTRLNHAVNLQVVKVTRAAAGAKGVGGGAGVVILGVWFRGRPWAWNG